MLAENKTIGSFVIKKDDLQKLKELASENNRTVSVYVRMLVELDLEKNAPKNPN